MNKDTLAGALSRTALLLIAVIALLGLAAMAQDEEAPTVVGPADAPGADVVWFAGTAYTLDATGSTDNEGIASYWWDVTAPDGTVETVGPTASPTASWTPAEPGIYRVASWAIDDAGNAAFHVFAMDAVEVLSAQTVVGTDVSYDHSVAVINGTLSYSDLSIDVTGGRPADVAPSTKGEQLTEDVTYKGASGGALAGHWEPRYTDGWAGDVYRDTDMKLVGQASIRNSGEGDSYDAYGFRYVFDSPQDLTQYDSLVFWVKSTYEWASFSEVDFYGENPDWPYIWDYVPINPGYGQMLRGWWGVTVPLDFAHLGYSDNYGVDPTQVGSFSIYLYGGYMGRCWIDGAYFAKEQWGDNITESAAPAGEWSGYWSDGTTSDMRFVGGGSVQFYQQGYSSTTLAYNWDGPVDLSGYDALRMLTWFDGWSVTLYEVDFYDDQGNSAYLYSSESTDWGTYFSYGSSSYGRWYMASVALDPNMYDGYVDWTRVTRMELLTWSYDSGNLYVDGLEFYEATSSTMGAPSISEDIPHGIYALQDGVLKMTDVHFMSSSPMGAFVRVESQLYATRTVFEDLWGTSHPSIRNSARSYGGVMAFGADKVDLKDVKVVSAAASGLYIENSNLTADGLDVSGTSSAFPGSAGLIVALSGTRATDVDTVKVLSSKFHDSPQGSGLMVLSADARGTATVVIDGATARGNGPYGAVVEVVGTSSDLTIAVLSSTFELNKGSGLGLYIHDSVAMARTQLRLSVDDTELDSNGQDGALVSVARSTASAQVSLTRADAHDNDGAGLAIDVSRIAGALSVALDSVSSHENLGAGLSVATFQAGFQDPSGAAVRVEGSLSISMTSCSLDRNEGSGVDETHSFTGDWETLARPSLKYTVTASESSFEGNQLDGYSVAPRDRPELASRIASYSFTDSTFRDNAGAGFRMREYYSNYEAMGTTSETYSFMRCTFEYNSVGIYQWWDGYSEGVETHVIVRGSTFTDNDKEAIHAEGATDYYDGSGSSYLRVAEYDIQDTLLDGPVHLDITGAHDSYGSVTPSIKVTLVNDTYTSDVPMFIRMGAYMWSQANPLEATLVVKDVTFTLPSTEDGLHVEMYGGAKLKAIVDIEGERIQNPLGDGIHVTLGTLSQDQGTAKGVTGMVTVRDTTVVDAIGSGLVMEVVFAEPTLATSRTAFSVDHLTVIGAEEGLQVSYIDGIVQDSSFARLRERTVHAYHSVIDVLSSEVGSISSSNLLVDEKGAIRLWFEMRVLVVWRDTGAFVKGTGLEMKDNSWNIIGINTVDDASGVRFTNLNAYTILPDGVFTRNPYIITADYIGITKEVRAQVDGNIVVTIQLVDDILPRLTIETPADGLAQRGHDIEVKGTAYDKHTGLDRVVVSIDGVTWAQAAVLSDGFTYRHTVTGVPEGLTVVRVRAYDHAGNYKELISTVQVDSTPPSLELMSPADGLVTATRSIEVVGTTDIGTRVFINDNPVAVTYTLISRTLVLMEGPNAVKVTAVDYLGNVNQIVRYVTLDTQAPYIAMVTEDSTVNTPTVTVTGLTEPTGVAIDVAGAPVTVDAEGRFTAPVTLKDGINRIDIHGVDTVGNERHVHVAIALDRTPPWVRLMEPLSDTVTVRDVPVKGLVEQGARVFVNDREVEVRLGYFETVVSTREGPFALRVSAVDQAGNEAVLERALDVDTMAPTVGLTFPPEGYTTNLATMTVVGTLSLDGESAASVRLIDLYIAGSPRLFDLATGEFSQDVQLEEGVNRIAVRAVDGAGNEVTVVRTVMLDSEAPYLSVAIGGTRMDPNWREPVATGPSVRVTGFTEVGASLMVNGVSVQVDTATGSFDYVLELPAPAGGLRITTTVVSVVATDAAGNAQAFEQKVNRVSTPAKGGEGGIGTAEWALLALAMVVFAMSFAGAIVYSRLADQEAVIEELEADHSRSGGAPPGRPARGGTGRRRPGRPQGTISDDVLVDLEEQGGTK